MALLEHLILSGRIIDIMLVFLAIETLVLVWRHVKTGRGPTTAAIITNAGAGGSLMLALKAVLTGAAWQLLAAALVASLFFHTTDVLMRWRESSKAAGGAPL